MMLRVDSTLALPVYEQIRSQVVRMVVAGTIEPGTRMPTIRQLANDLQLAKGTVAKAYSLLEQSSVLESRGHKGTFIIGPGDVGTDVSEVEDLNAAVDQLVVAARQLGFERDEAVDLLRSRWDLL